MRKTILIIDDDTIQAEQLKESLETKLPHYSFETASTEEEINYKVENLFYSLAIVDLRMDKYSIDGLTIIDKIALVNPFAKSIAISAFINEYIIKLKQYLIDGKIIDIVEKTTWSLLVETLETSITQYYNNSKDPLLTQSLTDIYAGVKNEPDLYIRGERLEGFIAILFRQMGFESINKRIKDKSLNEVDLIVRNDIDDSFLNKFGKYFLIECKNYSKDGVDKNTFIVFRQKIKNTGGLSEFGIIATTSYIKRTTYIEAVRASEDNIKIVFISNPEIERLINANNILDEFKALIDEQVKDN